MNRIAVAVIAVLTVGLVAGTAAAENWTPVATTGNSVLVEEDTRLKNLDPIFAQLFLPDQDEDVKLTSIVQFFPIDPGLLGIKKVKKGRGKATVTCQSPTGVRSLGSKTVKPDDNGNFVYTDEISGNLNCDFFQVQWDFLRKSPVIPGGTSIAVNTAVELIGPGADDECFDATVQCLNDDRFRVEIDWRTPQGPGGSAVGLPRTDDSGLFFFFNPDNWEMLVKVLDGCNVNNHFWVFHAATTDVEYTLRVTDSLTGMTRDYGNDLGRPAPAIIDTQAFATCP